MAFLFKFLIRLNPGLDYLATFFPSLRAQREREPGALLIYFSKRNKSFPPRLRIIPTQYFVYKNRIVLQVYGCKT